MELKETKEETQENKLNKIFRATLPYIIIVIAVALIRTFIVTPVQVEGMSMYSTLDDNEILLLKKYDKNYQRFDIVVFNYNGTKLIKRVIGLPGEAVAYKDNKLYINGEYMEEDFLKNHQETYDFTIEEIGYDTIPNGYYFVMGDNRTNSTDSRIIGLVPEEDIEGTTSFAIFPFDKFGNFNK